MAEAIGTGLARRAERAEVPSVTHAPQVAARAASHLLLAQEAVDNGSHVTTRDRPIADEHRGWEIARMLAGSRITEEARAAADKPVAGA